MKGVGRFPKGPLGFSTVVVLLLTVSIACAAAVDLASVSGDSAWDNRASSAPAISADGRRGALQSLAANLFADDGNGSSDVFVCTSAEDIATSEVFLSVTPGVLWPPNKRYVPVRIDRPPTIRGMSP